MATPEGWGSISLEDLMKVLPQADWAHIFATFDANAGDMMQAMDDLKGWFREPERARRLERHGFDAAFASYFFPYHIGQQPEGFRQVYAQLVGQGWPEEDSFSESRD